MEKKQNEQAVKGQGQTQMAPMAPVNRPVMVRKVDPFVKLKSKIHEELVAAVEPSLLSGAEDPAKKQELERKLTEIVGEIIDEEAPHLTGTERQRITTDIIDEVMGFGPITPLLTDPSISEVMVNGPKQVYVERSGRIESPMSPFEMMPTCAYY